MRILLTSTSLMPSHGGPAYSITRLALALTKAGVEVGLWASDQSVLTTPMLPVQTNVRRLTGSVAEGLVSFGLPDVLHDNGIWLPHNHHIARLAAERHIPRMVSPRGMLEPWATRHKRVKKNIAWHLYQRRDLRGAQILHSTAMREAGHLERLRLGVAICIIPNGVDLPQAGRNKAVKTSSAASDTKQRTALFLGRISPVKGLPMLVEAWARVRPQGWRLQIAGPDEAGHRVEIERTVLRAGLNKFISFLGSVDAKDKGAAYSDADLFILPSHSENFGIVVAEALAHGVPVLTTTGTPWLEIAERGCGWLVEPNVYGITQGLRLATAQESAMLHAMGANGRDWIASQFNWDMVAKQFIVAYNQSIARAQLSGAAS